MSLVLFHKADHIAWITLNSPEQLNAMDVAMGEEFSALLDKIAADKDIRVVVITGAGKAFSSGGNLDMLLAKIEKTRETNHAELKSFYRMFLKVREIPQPVIAMINGPAVGAGFCMSLACDLRYAADTAKLGANFSRLGLAPGMGGTFLITRLAGPVHAAEILLKGEVFDAKQALVYGLINGIVPANELKAHVTEVAKHIASCGPIPVKQIKQGIQQALNSTLEEMFDYDAAAQAICFESEDIKEGVAAIREKRAPRFTGK